MWNCLASKLACGGRCDYLWLRLRLHMRHARMVTSALASYTVPFACCRPSPDLRTADRPPIDIERWLRRVSAPLWFKDMQMQGSAAGVVFGVSCMPYCSSVRSDDPRAGRANPDPVPRAACWWVLRSFLGSILFLILTSKNQLGYISLVVVISSILCCSTCVCVHNFSDPCA